MSLALGCSDREEPAAGAPPRLDLSSLVEILGFEPLLSWNESYGVRVGVGVVYLREGHESLGPVTGELW